MSDFTHDFWGWYVAVITLASIVACALLLKAMSTSKLRPGEDPGVTGHVWDQDLAEYNNPLPNWWRWMFYITIVLGLAYLALFPGLGKFDGMLGWSASRQYGSEMADAERSFGPLYARYMAMDVKAVAADAQAREMGQRLFLNYCAQCHASDGRGSRGFPDLSDNDWLYGGEPDTIKATITAGRQGMMPPFAALGGEAVKDTTHYVMSLSGLTHDSVRSARGRAHFEQNCAACHGVQGSGNAMLGAPNLSDAIWLHGTGETTIAETIAKGRHNVMPPWGDFLGESKTHLLAAYVWGLSNVR